MLDPEDTEKTDPDDDTEFTFTLEQFEDPDDESSLIPGAGIPFTVYDKESGEEISQGITDENGTFTLKGGQYALFEVREETKWKVTEEEPQEYHVKKLDICGEVSDDDPGNSAVLDLRTPDPTTDPVRCQTLKGYMTPYLDTPNDDDKLERFYRIYRNHEIKTSHPEYARMSELEGLVRKEALENIYSYTEKYYEYKEELDAIRKRITDHILDVLVEEIGEGEKNVFPICMADRIRFLFGDKCHNLYDYILQHFED